MLDGSGNALLSASEWTETANLAAAVTLILLVAIISTAFPRKPQ
jgi:hypothetical protein